MPVRDAGRGAAGHDAQACTGRRARATSTSDLALQPERVGRVSDEVDRQPRRERRARPQAARSRSAAASNSGADGETARQRQQRPAANGRMRLRGWCRSLSRSTRSLSDIYRRRAKAERDECERRAATTRGQSVNWWAPRSGRKTSRFLSHWCSAQRLRPSRASRTPRREFAVDLGDRARPRAPAARVDDDGAPARRPTRRHLRARCRRSRSRRRRTARPALSALCRPTDW